MCAGSWTLRFREPVQSTPSQELFRKSEGKLPTGPGRGSHTTALGKCYKLGPFPVFLENQSLNIHRGLQTSFPSLCCLGVPRCCSLLSGSLPLHAFSAEPPPPTSHVLYLAPAMTGNPMPHCKRRVTYIRTLVNQASFPTNESVLNTACKNVFMVSLRSLPHTCLYLLKELPSSLPCTPPTPCPKQSVITIFF